MPESARNARAVNRDRLAPRRQDADTNRPRGGRRGRINASAGVASLRRRPSITERLTAAAMYQPSLCQVRALGVVGSV